jgi:hypothetical protein
MRTAIIYISGITGGILLIFRAIGIVAEFSVNGLLLYSGLFLLLLICIPVFLYDRHLRNKEIRQIIASYKGKEKKPVEIKEGKSEVEEWGINNPPFRDHHSGLSWGGGNIHAANASRGTRRTFLKRR